MILAARESFAAVRRGDTYDRQVPWLANAVGNQVWADTGIVGDNTTEVDIEFSVTNATASQSIGVFGSYYVGSHQYMLYRYGNESGKARFGWDLDSRESGYQLSNVILVKAGWYTAHLARTWTLDSYTSSEMTGVAFSNTGSLALGTCLQRTLQGAVAPLYDGAVRIKSCKIWKSGFLVRDIIPVVKGGVGYFFDKVTRRLMPNMGTGAWTVCPYDAEVVYIEFPGAQYVNTGIVPALNRRYTLWFTDYSVAAQTATPWFFGSRTAYQSNGLGAYYGGTMLYGAVGNQQKSVALNKSLIEGSAVHTLTVSSAAAGGVWLDGTNRIECSNPSFNNPSASIYIGAINLNGTAGTACIALRVRKFAEGRYETGGDIVHDEFQPVRVGSVGYFFNYGDGLLYGNAVDGGNGFPAACVGPDRT